MQKLKLFTLLVMLCATPLWAQKELKKIMVDQEWLKTHMNDEDVVILHVSYPDEYEKGHIPGSRVIVPQEYSVMNGNLAWELPSADSLAKKLTSKGITNQSRIVLVHGGGDHAATFRLYFTLDYFGLSKNTVILDGGLKGWRANGLETTTDSKQIREVDASALKLKVNSQIKVDKDYVRTNAGTAKTNVIDARRANYYEGAEDTREHYKRSGHISGAGNVCWMDIVDENLFLKDTETLKALFEVQGVDKKEEVVAYCHVGLRASVIYTIAKGLGYRARLYDGSYNEWDTLDEEYKVTVGKSKK